MNYSCSKELHELTAEANALRSAYIAKEINKVSSRLSKIFVSELRTTRTQALNVLTQAA